MGTPLLPVRVSRRSVLAGGTVSILGTFLLGTSLAACSSPSSPKPAPTPEPDDLAVGRAVATAQHLREDALRLAAADRALAGQFTAAAADHAVHLSALGSPVTDPSPSPPASSAAPSAGSSARPSPAVTAAAPTAGGQLGAEWLGARESLRDAINAESAGLAALLTRIAATRAVHADLLATSLRGQAMPKLTEAEPIPVASPSPSSLAGTGSPAGTSPSTSTSSTASVTGPGGEPSPSDTPWLQALGRLLAGEHAAVFAYPLVIVPLSGPARAQAQAQWQEHQANRNELTQILVRAGAEPVAAAPAYQVTRPATAATARGLAAAVELGLAGLAADALAAGTGAKDRTFAAQELITAARRSANWSGRSSALPGLAETVAQPTVSATAT